jgi:two-component system, NtrC family, C4-dicarboxylate transport response regulator DctD
MTVADPQPVAIIDDEPEVRNALRQLLELEGLAPLEFGDSEAALAKIGADFAGVVIADLRMPGLDGIGLFKQLSRLDPELPVVMISGHGDIATAVDLVRRGAYDFLSKPFDAEHMLATVRRALDKRALALENRSMRQMQPASGGSALLGQSHEIERVRQTIDQLVQADMDVLITGESGTGKTLITSILHRRSPRARKNMITVDCRALPDEQADSLLFGHVSGAFPGAQLPRTGQLLFADSGTLLLDHVDGMPQYLQSRLQHALEQGSITPVGGNKPQPTRFRTLSTSSLDVAAMTRIGDFLPSLYFRLGGYCLSLPPLRTRGDDVILLFRTFLVEEAEKLGRDPPKLTPNVWRRLKDHDWPGNVRELHSFAANVAIDLQEGGVVRPEPSPAGGLKLAVAQFEADVIRAALERNKGDVTATITELDLPRKTFYDKLARHGIDASEYRSGK